MQSGHQGYGHQQQEVNTVGLMTLRIALQNQKPVLSNAVRNAGIRQRLTPRASWTLHTPWTGGEVQAGLGTLGHQGDVLIAGGEGGAVVT